MTGHLGSPYTLSRLPPHWRRQFTVTEQWQQGGAVTNYNTAQMA